MDFPKSWMGFGGTKTPFKNHSVNSQSPPTQPQWIRLFLLFSQILEEPKWIFPNPGWVLEEPKRIFPFPGRVLDEPKHPFKTHLVNSPSPPTQPHDGSRLGERPRRRRRRDFT